MAIGPGKYDDVCTKARIETNATGTLLIILDGNKGSGFSCQIDKKEIARLRIPDILENMARQIRNDI